MADAEVDMTDSFAMMKHMRSLVRDGDERLEHALTGEADEETVCHVVEPYEQCYQFLVALLHSAAAPEAPNNQDKGMNIEAAVERRAAEIFREGASPPLSLMATDEDIAGTAITAEVVQTGYWALVSKADALYCLQEYEECLSEIARVSAVMPGAAVNPLLHLRAAQCSFYTGNLRAALAYSSEALHYGGMGIFQGEPVDLVESLTLVLPSFDPDTQPVMGELSGMDALEFAHFRLRRLLEAKYGTPPPYVVEDMEGLGGEGESDDSEASM